MPYCEIYDRIEMPTPTFGRSLGATTVEHVCMFKNMREHGHSRSQAQKVMGAERCKGLEGCSYLTPRLQSTRSPCYLGPSRRPVPAARRAAREPQLPFDIKSARADDDRRAS